MDYFRSKIEPIQNNQAHLPVEKRIKPRKGGPFVAFEEELNDEVESKSNPKEEIVIGVYSKKKLKDFFSKNQPEIERLQAQIEEWLDAIFVLIVRIYEQERKKEKANK